MMRIAIPLIAIVALLASCASEPSRSTTQAAAGRKIADGEVTRVNRAHGNLYTNIAPDQYEALGLNPGETIHVVFDDTAVTTPLGRDYSDVPVGSPVAVLHREGLTFAIRDGDFSTTYGIGAGARFTISSVPAQR